MKKQFSYTFITLLIFTGNYMFAQLPYLTMPERTETRTGNKHLKEGNYSDAEASFKKALETKNNMPEAIYNLGNAEYKQQRFEDAAKQYQLSAQTNPDSRVKASALHNVGNTFLEQQKWKEAAESFKKALQQNPNDAETKYNLAYANAKLKEQQQSDKSDSKQKDNKQQQDQKQQQNQQKDNQQQQANNQQNKQQPQPRLSKEDAEKLLQALQNEEQKTNQKVQQQEARPVQVIIRKDW